MEKKMVMGENVIIEERIVVSASNERVFFPSMVASFLQFLFMGASWDIIRGIMGANWWRPIDGIVWANDGIVWANDGIMEAN